MDVLRTSGLAAELRQGDILEISTPLTPYGCRAGVILTADCDLVQGKHYGHLLICPILTAKEYFSKIWLPKKLEKLRHRLSEKVRLKLAACDPGLDEISDDYLDLVIRDEGSIRTVLRDATADTGAVDELVVLSNSLQNLSDGSAGIDVYISAQCLISTKSAEKLRADMLSEFRSSLTQDSGDIVVLPDMLTPSSLAHVVILRSPFSVALSTIGEVFGDAVSAKRVASYETPVKFLIAQKFGYLFSRIGMPGHIEKERSDCVSILEI